MDHNTSNSPPDTIHISREEASSSHVDDLLRRQKSLRGESGVTRERGRHWYYQNWLVFMVAGLAATVIGWALLEPYFNDLVYFQGVVEEINDAEVAPRHVQFGDQMMEIKIPGKGWIKIRGERIWLLEDTKEIRPGGAKEVVQLENLKAGEELGVYLQYLDMGPQSMSLSRFLVQSPIKQSPKEAALTLAQLDARSDAASLLLFPVMAGLIGLVIGATDGLICRMIRRALLAGGVGLFVGFIGGFVSSFLGGLIYVPLNALALKQEGNLDSLTTFGFLLQMTGRTFAWGLAGMAMGLGQGIALRSKRLFLYGFLGGLLGGLLGGMLFDPIDLLILGMDKPSAHWSRLVGFAVIGASVGAMIGIVELLARDAWLRMTEGPLAGKEFLLFKDVMQIGASPRSDIYLFNDPAVAPHHATLRIVGDACEIENREQGQPVLLNGRPIRGSRLRHGDQITLGRTVFVFQKRQG